MKIKIEPFLMKKGNRVAKAAIEFEQKDDSLLAGWHLVGFTICDDPQKGLFVLFPAVNSDAKNGERRTFFFLRPENDDKVTELEQKILDVYESMTAFNTPHKAAPGQVKQ